MERSRRKGAGGKEQVERSRRKGAEGKERERSRGKGERKEQKKGAEGKKEKCRGKKIKIKTLLKRGNGRRKVSGISSCAKSSTSRVHMYITFKTN